MDTVGYIPLGVKQIVRSSSECVLINGFRQCAQSGIITLVVSNLCFPRTEYSVEILS